MGFVETVRSFSPSSVRSSDAAHPASPVLPPGLLPSTGQVGDRCPCQGPRALLQDDMPSSLLSCEFVGCSPLSSGCLHVTVNTVWIQSKLALISQPPDYSLEEPVEGLALPEGGVGT